MPHTCPWWLTYTFDNPLRRLLHDPIGMLRPWVRDGMRAADLGCGMGHFTLGLAELVGPTGHVQAVDLQREQLERVRRRLERRALSSRVDTVQAEPERLGIDGPLDFVLAFWMVHEVRAPGRFFDEVRRHLAPEGRMLVVEPRVHVPAERFARALASARAAGLAPTDVSVPIRWSRAALLAPQPRDS